MGNELFIPSCASELNPPFLIGKPNVLVNDTFLFRPSKSYMCEQCTYNYSNHSNNLLDRKRTNHGLYRPIVKTHHYDVYGLLGGEA
jgi:hypothetical protein